MKRVITACALILITASVASAQQEGETDVRKKVEELGGQVSGHDESIKTLETDVSALKKIKISGYVQMQMVKTEKASGFATDPYDAKDAVKARFQLRRSRIKITYDGGTTHMAVQGDYSNEGFTLKDAYLEFTEPWANMVAFRAGLFNRPNYEVEYSSSQRESPERSGVIRALYPGERDLGAMITVSPEDLFTLQLAAFNNNFKGGFNATTDAGKYPAFSSAPFYYMARLRKSFTFDDLGIDLGVHGRFGSVRANTSKFLESDMPTNAAPSTTDTLKVGDNVSRSWFGVEAQIYYDFLGGMKILGEYITGKDVNELSTTGTTPLRKRDFNGFYVMLVKNIGTEFQFAAKYDSYNPNTAISADKINLTSELAVNTLGLGIHNYTFDKVRLTLWYDLISTKTNDRILKTDPKDNVLTVRAQYKF